MYDEYQSVDQEPTRKEIKKAQNQRNAANNAELIKAAANIASSSGIPYASQIGSAIKAADKLSGGRASMAAGKLMSKTTPKSAQKVANAAGKVASLANRIADAKSKNSIPNSQKKATMKSNNVGNSSSKMKEAKDQSDGGSASVDFTTKVVKWGLIFCVGAFFLMLPFCLLMSASNIYIKSIGLGNADSVSFENAESKINKKQEDAGELEEGVTEDDLSFDVFIENSTSFRTKKLESSNLIKIAKTTYLKRKYTEADLSKLEDFYPDVVSLSKNNNENMVYDFFFKMYNLYTTYRDTYNVHLDLPLLMSTLMVQSDDMYVIFNSNLSEEDKAKKPRKKPIKEFDYYYDWSGHILQSDTSTNDMEILAQRMVSYQVKETCVDASGKVTQEKILRDNETKNQVLFCVEGETYKREDLGMQKDTEKFKEFLKEFLEKKYYVVDEIGLSSNPVDGLEISTGTSSTTEGNSFADAMINVANNEYKLTNGEKYGMKYINAYGNSSFGKGTPWCAIFAWYVSANTKYNGKSLYPDIIPFKTASTGEYIRLFNSSSKENLNFYYNDSCKNLKGKNGSLNYIPKKGDFIFFDWQKKFSGLPSNEQDHTAIVEKYENGKIYTIEGNMSNTIVKRSYSITNCQVIGFGSWY